MRNIIKPVSRRFLHYLSEVYWLRFILFLGFLNYNAYGIYMALFHDTQTEEFLDVNKQI